MFASLKAALGDLVHITAWLTVSGHVNAKPGHPQTTTVINPDSELIVNLLRPTLVNMPVPPSEPPRSHSTCLSS